MNKMGYGRGMMAVTDEGRHHVIGYLPGVYQPSYACHIMLMVPLNPVKPGMSQHLPHACKHLFVKWTAGACSMMSARVR